MDETKPLYDGLTGSFCGLVSIASTSMSCGSFLATYLQAYSLKFNSHCRVPYEHLL